MSESIYKFPPYLSLQLVPAGAWNQNLRSVWDAKTWKAFRQIVFRNNGTICAFCSSKPKSLDCHEIWDYTTDDGGTNIQKLVNVLPLCKSCHQVCHYGFWMTKIDPLILNRHFCKVRKISAKQAAKEINDSFVIHEKLSNISEWDLDISLTKLPMWQ